jgi:hypothetical protein
MPIDVVFDRSQRYDLIVATCGYEKRSSYLCRLGVTATHRIAIVHEGTTGLVYEENVRIYQSAEWSLVDIKAALTRLTELANSGSVKTMAVDVSSMPRAAIAYLIELLNGLDPAIRLDVSFLYCPADFSNSSAAANLDGPMSANPVSSYYSGVLRPPSIPIGLIVGLGLEPYRAAGIVELLEPARTWYFIPSQGDERFVEESARVHQPVLTLADTSDIFEYNIHSLSSTFSALDSLCFSTGLRFRLIMAPSGPKLFSLACLLVAAKRDPARPAVWRVGSSSRMESVSVEAAGDVTASCVVFGRR